MPTLEELQALMRVKLADVGIAVDAGVPARREKDRAPLSFAQRAVWSHQQRVPDSTANNICLAFTYTGEVDADALRRALSALVARHEILRTTYHLDTDGSGYQRIHESLPPRLHSLDYSGDADADAALEQLVAELAVEPFDLATESSIRLTFVTLPHSESGQPRLSVIIAMQHIIWDGMTLPAMSRDVEGFYREAVANPGQDPRVTPLSPQVADFAEWEVDRFAANDQSADSTFWENQFRDIETAILPYDRTPETASEISARIDRTLSPRAEANLRSLSTALRVTPFSVFLATYYLALRDLTGRDEVLVGTTVANREETGMDALIGNFSNSVVLRLGTEGNAFADLVKHVRSVTDTAFAHRGFPFEHVVELARKVTGDATAFPYDSLVLFIDQELAGPQLPGATTRWELADKGRTLLPLTVETFMHADHTDVQISYRVDLFDPPTVERIHDSIAGILEAATADRPWADLLSTSTRAG